MIRALKGNSSSTPHNWRVHVYFTCYAILMAATAGAIPSSIQSDQSQPIEPRVFWGHYQQEIPWDVRAGHTSLVFADHAWLIGGQTSCSIPEGQFADEVCLLGDVWKSADGDTWTEVTATAPWGLRAGHASAVFQDKMWVLGGLLPVNSQFGAAVDESVYANDVWSSSDGETWTQVLPSAPWASRFGHECASFDGKLWVMGGIGDADLRYNDVWNSADGINWTQVVAAAEWPANWYGGAFVFRDKIWLAERSGARLWSSGNGIDWTLSSAPLSWRYALIYDNSIWLFQPNSEFSIYSIWFSHDGENWNAPARSGGYIFYLGGGTAYSFRGRIWQVAGATLGTHQVPGGPSRIVYFADFSSFHDTDRDYDGAISMSELLRIIQFYQAGGYHCDADGEDGYAPGFDPAAQTCTPHENDHAPQDWRIDLPELLRAIQFFNVGGYLYCPDANTEDGFCPGVAE